MPRPYFTRAEIDALIVEDLPRHDDTSLAIAMPDVPGELTLRTRHATTIAGSAVCRDVAEALGLTVVEHAADGAALEAGTAALRLRGGAHALHVAWKPVMNLLEYCSGIATCTATVLRAVRAVAPGVRIAATRKAFPGARKLQQYAVVCGGGLVHRTGLSESVLIFPQHRAFCGEATVAELIGRARARAPERFVLVEADSETDALAAADAGCDGVQIDKMKPERLLGLVRELRARRPGPGFLIGAAGGIDAANAARYAATGVDVLVTSSLYQSAPADFGATLLPRAGPA